jgi:hypothetical protein
MKRTTKRRLGLAAIIAGVIMIMGGCSSNESNDPDGTVVTVQQPLTAHQIADKIGCTQFKGLPVTGVLYVVNLGTCYRDGKKYAIDTFATTAARDAWLKVSENFGVVPKWETATAVIYPSITTRR